MDYTIKFLNSAQEAAQRSKIFPRLKVNTRLKVIKQQLDETASMVRLTGNSNYLKLEDVAEIKDLLDTWQARTHEIRTELTLQLERRGFVADNDSMVTSVQQQQRSMGSAVQAAEDIDLDRPELDESGYPDVPSIDDHDESIHGTQPVIA